MSIYKNRTPAAVLRAILLISADTWAELLGCSLSTIHSLECGRLNMSDKMANRMSIESGISPDWLLGKDAKAKPVTLYNQPYSKTYYDVAQAAKGNRSRPHEIHVAMDVLDLSARLLAILTSARKHHYQLAIYKATKTVQALGAEFGQDTAIYEPKESYSYPRQALTALKKVCEECEAKLSRQALNTVKNLCKKCESEMANPVGAADRRNREAAARQKVKGGRNSKIRIKT